MCAENVENVQVTFFQVINIKIFAEREIDTHVSEIVAHRFNMNVDEIKSVQPGSAISQIASRFTVLKPNINAPRFVT